MMSHTVNAVGLRRLLTWHPKYLNTGMQTVGGNVGKMLEKEELAGTATDWRAVPPSTLTRAVPNRHPHSARIQSTRKVDGAI
jgi:hypothetical protein